MKALAWSMHIGSTKSPI